MIHKYLFLTSNNTKQYIFVWKIFNLDLMINKPFYNLRPENWCWSLSYAQKCESFFHIFLNSLLKWIALNELHFPFYPAFTFLI